MLEDLQKQAEMEHLKNMFAAKNECYTPNVLKSMILETQEKIYSSLNINEMKMLNMGGDNQKDPSGQIIGQMMQSYN